MGFNSVAVSKRIESWLLLYSFMYDVKTLKVEIIDTTDRDYFFSRHTPDKLKVIFGCDLA